ncbi:hypothetical protein EL09_23950 [Salmonella enterica subsp. enterica]|nr:hypothetical protein [Salmonella enterica subsp. enterica]EDV3053074.1 hypothetical protein [Salmonella enterica subsp. enterica]MIF52714.1 hypothetical protein [Salmonella enterica subsp. enterica]
MTACRSEEEGYLDSWQYGAPEELTDSDGEIVWETGYQVWGNTIQEKDHGGVEQNLRYQGQYLDRETGLHYNIHRYFDPDVGRFTTTDPISIRGGLNLYRYAPNPFNWIDPLGLTNLAAAQQQIDAVLREHLPAIQQIDPNATIGYRGSAASGISKAHDPSISRSIDFNNFDVDAYIKKDYLANHPVFKNRRRDAAKIAGMKEIEASIDRKLRAIFPGLRAEPFGFRIFKTHELSDLARHGDTQHNVGCK